MLNEEDDYNFLNNKAIRFLDWFLYSDNTIDGQSKIGKNAYFDAMREGVSDSTQIKQLFEKRLNRRNQ